MLVPFVVARIEQRGNGVPLGITACEVWAFAKIAVDAGGRKVAWVVRAAMLARDDVLDLQRSKRRVDLVTLAVFETLAGAIDDQFPRCGGNYGAEEPSARRRRAMPRKTAKRLLART
jgi:hypothetical protein